MPFYGSIMSVISVTEATRNPTHSNAKVTALFTTTPLGLKWRSPPSTFVHYQAQRAHLFHARL